MATFWYVLYGAYTQYTYFKHEMMSETKVGFNMQSEWVLGKWKTVIYLWIEWLKPQQSNYAMVAHCVHFVNNHTDSNDHNDHILLMYALTLPTRKVFNYKNTCDMGKKNHDSCQWRWWTSKRMPKGAVRKSYFSNDRHALALQLKH